MIRYNNVVVIVLSIIIKNNYNANNNVANAFTSVCFCNKPNAFLSCSSISRGNNIDRKYSRLLASIEEDVVPGKALDNVSANNTSDDNANDNGIGIVGGAVLPLPSEVDKKLLALERRKYMKKQTNRTRTRSRTRTSTSTTTISSRNKYRKKRLTEVTPTNIDATNGFNIVLTHVTADFDTLASAVGLAKLWSSPTFPDNNHLPTFVVLPRGAHPGVQKFLSLHKHLFPIRSLRGLPSNLDLLHKLALVDAQRRDRIGPAEHLLSYANNITILDHHLDGTSDIPEATEYIVESVGSVSTLVAEKLQKYHVEITEAEATLLALGIHGDTGSLTYDCSTPRDAYALAWCMSVGGASQDAIAEHVQVSLSVEQQSVLTQALLNTNSTNIHGVTISTVLLSADGFINGLAAVAQDALDLTGSDVILLSLVYDAKSSHRKQKQLLNSVASPISKSITSVGSGTHLNQQHHQQLQQKSNKFDTESWKGGEEALKKRRLKASFDKKDTDYSGTLDRNEIIAALAASGVIASNDSVDSVMSIMDKDGDGTVDFEEFCAFASLVEQEQNWRDRKTGKRPSTMIIIGRVKAGISLKHVNLNRLFKQYGGGGHPKAASATLRLEDESEAHTILQLIVDEMIETSLLEQQTVGDFMTAPVLSAKPDMTEKQVEDLFTRFDVRALPVVNEQNHVIGLVTYKEVAAAKQRLWNKEQKRLRHAADTKHKPKEIRNNNNNNNNSTITTEEHQLQQKKINERKLGSALKGWMKQHIKIVEASRTMAEVEAMLLENDVGCIPVVADGTQQLVGMVTRTDLLRQHRYYPSLVYENKGFSDSLAARKPLVELRKRLKKFDLED